MSERMMVNISSIKVGMVWISMRAFFGFVSDIWFFMCGTLVLFDALHSEIISLHMLRTYVGTSAMRSEIILPFHSSPKKIQSLHPNCPPPYL